MPASMVDWDVEQVAEWAKSIKLDPLVDIVRREFIVGATLMQMTESDWRDLGAPFGLRKAIVAHVQRYLGR